MTLRYEPDHVCEKESYFMRHGRTEGDAAVVKWPVITLLTNL